MEHPESGMTSALLFWAILAPTITGLITLWLPRKNIGARVFIAALGPITAFMLVVKHINEYGLTRFDGHGVMTGTNVIHWVDVVNLNFTFMADGLSAFFALLISGVGLLIVLYARAYLGKNEADLFRFLPTLGFFMTAMLGIVMSDSMLLTILFWEMTSISSFLLIGWDRYDPKAVKLAMQAFFTTGLGGMSALGGIILFGVYNDCWTWTDLLSRFALTAGHGESAAAGLPVNWVSITAYAMMALGAATKSAQWPWQYWLPGAMAAPTPVSAYLHSATMVKAGIFLTARLFPVFSQLEMWPWVILIPGAITMFYGAVVAVNQHDLKRIFAYTTVSQLGLLMCVYGLGALNYLHDGHLLPAIDWDITQIANHAFYKAPLFILAGAIGHVAGTRQLPELFGFFKTHRIMTILLILAAYALAGGPGTISFPAKELFFYSIYHAFEIHWIFKVLAVMAVLTAVCNVSIFVRLTTTLMGWKPGLKAAPKHSDSHHAHDDHHEHETGLWAAMLWIPAAVLVLFQYVGGLYPPAWNAVFTSLETNINYAAFASGMPFFWQVHWGVPLIMSICAISIGILFGLSPFMRGTMVDPHDKIYPAMYWLAVTGGGRAFETLQTGKFRQYMLIILVALLFGFAGAVWIDPRMLNVDLGSAFEFWPAMAMGCIVCGSALLMPVVQARVIRVLVLGVCGFSVIGMYLLLQAPDLALTQVMFEIISVILFVLVLRMLPTVDRKKSPNRVMRISIGAMVGVIVGWMTLLASQAETVPALGEWFYAHSYKGLADTAGRGGGGQNIVNVVLVDFRGFDTLGEITVLSLAALMVWSLLPRIKDALSKTGGGGASPPSIGLATRDLEHHHEEGH